jgi:hypothetical protein
MAESIDHHRRDDGLRAARIRRSKLPSARIAAMAAS